MCRNVYTSLMTDERKRSDAEELFLGSRLSLITHPLSLPLKIRMIESVESHHNLSNNL